MGKLLDLDGYQAVSTKLKEYIDLHTLSTVVPQKTHLEFPTIGDPNSLYLDMTANEIYRWDDENIKYFRVGTDYHNIEVISGGNSTK